MKYIFLRFHEIIYLLVIFVVGMVLSYLGIINEGIVTNKAYEEVNVAYYKFGQIRRNYGDTIQYFGHILPS